MTISTTHKYKGLEQSAVIVLDALDRSYPLIHPTWVFLRVFGDTIEALEEEERRLFYVATTRAAGSLAIVTDGTRASPYLNDIQAHQPLQDVCWDNLRSALAPLGTQLEVRVFKAFEVRDELKRLGFRFDGSTKAWLKVCLPKGSHGNSCAPPLGVGA